MFQCLCLNACALAHTNTCTHIHLSFLSFIDASEQTPRHTGDEWLFLSCFHKHQHIPIQFLIDSSLKSESGIMLSYFSTETDRKHIWIWSQIGTFSLTLASDSLLKFMVIFMIVWIPNIHWCLCRSEPCFQSAMSLIL